MATVQSTVTHQASQSVLLRFQLGSHYWFSHVSKKINPMFQKPQHKMCKAGVIHILQLNVTYTACFSPSRFWSPSSYLCLFFKITWHCCCEAFSKIKVKKNLTSLFAMLVPTLAKLHISIHLETRHHTCPVFVYRFRLCRCFPSFLKVLDW